MSEWAGKRYWLVGASEGLGREVAKKINRMGAEVIVSARSGDRLASLCDEMSGKCSAVKVDVTDAADVKRAAAEIGPVDGVIYLAGVYWPMKSQDWNADQVETMCDVNFTGAARVIGAVLPDMLAAGRGHIVLTGSLSGFRGLPGAMGYGASKAGIMYLAESLYADLRNTDIQVQLVNPGFIKTRLTDKNDFAMPFIMEPEIAAAEFVDHLLGDGFKKNFPTMFGAMFRLSQFLPDWLYYRIFAKG